MNYTEQQEQLIKDYNNPKTTIDWIKVEKVCKKYFNNPECSKKELFNFVKSKVEEQL